MVIGAENHPYKDEKIALKEAFNLKKVMCIKNKTYEKYL